MNTCAMIPMQSVGPIKIIGPVVAGEFMVPLATYESPLWPSTQRGAHVTARCGGIRASIKDDRMSRSVILETTSASRAVELSHLIENSLQPLADIPAQYSRFTKLIGVRVEIVASLLYVRFEFTTGDAAGQNMVTLASDHLMNYLLSVYSDLRYVSISGNYCTDKKVSAVNGILGRGKYVIADCEIDRKTCIRYLKTTPEKLVEINIKKNYIGSLLAGSVRSANADYANRLLGFYLALGQDAANIVEGSQGITFAEVREDQLYFSVTLPNLILGSVGNGKSLSFVQDNLKQLGCHEKRPAGENAKRLAAIAASTVLCGELSLLAAQTNPGELMRCHLQMERSS